MQVLNVRPLTAETTPYKRVVGLSPEDYAEHRKAQQREYYNRVAADQDKHAAAKARMREYYHAHKEKLNAERKEKARAAAQVMAADQARRMGRPPSQLTQAALVPLPPGPAVEPAAIVQQAERAKKAGLPPPSFIEVPEDLRSFLKVGARIEVDPDIRRWPQVSRLLEWDDLAKTSKPTYLRGIIATLKLAGIEPPSSLLPLDIAQMLVERAAVDQFDIWDTLRKVRDADTSHSSKNSMANGVNSILSMWVKRATDREDVTLRMWTEGVRLSFIALTWSGAMRRGAKDKHQSQELTEGAKANIVSWNVWSKLAEAYIRGAFTSKKDGTTTKKKGVMLPQMRDAVLVALYSLTPPIRNDWATVRIVDAAPAEGEKPDTNILVVPKDGGALRAYFVQFKNRKSFLRELPLQKDITDVTLQSILRQYVVALRGLGVSVLFPSGPIGTWGPTSRTWTNDELGSRLSDITKQLTSKSFTAQRMRISFLTWWWDAHRKSGKVNINEASKMMKEVHQSSISVSLSYDKGVEAIETAIASIRKEANTE